MNGQSVQFKTGWTKSSRLWLIMAGLVSCGLAGWGVWQFQTPATEPPPEVPVTAEISTVTALGRLEPAGELLHLTAPTSTQESRIKELLVEEGDRVEAGDIIAILDNRDRLAANLTTAQTQVKLAQSQLAQVQAGAKTGEIQAQVAEISRLQADREGRIATQQTQITRLQAEVENARTEANRYEFLHEQGAVTTSQRDAKRLQFTTAQQQLSQAQQELNRIQTTTLQQISQAQATRDRIAEVRPVDITTAQIAVQTAEAEVNALQAQLEQAYVRSPRSGQILEIHTHAGENIAAEGIVTIGNTQQMMAIAQVYQSDIPAVAVGQKATITSPILNAPLTGTVQRVGLQIQRQDVVNEDPAANIDAKVVNVDITLDPAASETVASLTNLQVTVKIETD
ncbi:MAG: ABC exporter membrane fusion protein [Jaaginema sp. PMC 1079.18]|nr:ABC exporter membrane fusion protein [Jaaginema sp. PMC 1080.18]MEC4852918.1 ABC exporter membrane fusion protein [Jaaginema sp. PMC 1079.18]MEC4868667.1 ABC exporter membrane fusion protein [Jaaginema sp. PMC 1078.18]